LNEQFNAIVEVDQHIDDLEKQTAWTRTWASTSTIWTSAGPAHDDLDMRQCKCLDYLDKRLDRMDDSP